MTPEERAALEARYWELEAQLQELWAGKVVGNPAKVEEELLAAQDEIVL